MNLYNFYIIAGIILIVLAIGFIWGALSNREPGEYIDIDDYEQRRAGREGEIINANRIETALNEDDIHLRGVEIDHDGKCECDNVIINKYGVFVIESKNYSGELSGDINDFYLTETKYYDNGDYVEKEVRNPIDQSNRQSGILHRYLKDNGIDVWVEGYAMNAYNDQYISDRMLHTKEDIDRAIHIKSIQNRHGLSKSKIDKIVILLNNK